ncbi:MAG: response regulator [Campylobacterota bacterium]|nr:response regulator [Campylobacterota bacterium]
MNLAEDLKLQTKNLRVLYVEDERDTRKQISQVLSIFFKEVIIGENGLEALEKYKENPDAIDLVMTDLTMPKMDGLTMIKHIRIENPNQHVIVLTAHNSSENLMETIDLQLDGFLLKPIKMDKMVELLLKVTKVINLEKHQCCK